MEETYSTKAIILNRFYFKEHNSKVIAFTERNGKIDLIARGTNKFTSKISSHIEPITLASALVVRGKNYNYLGSAISKNCYINIKNDFNKVSIAGQGVSVFNNLVKYNQVDKDLYNLLENYLDFLNQEKDLKLETNLMVDIFIFKLLCQLGLAPELHRCVDCQKKIVPEKNKFSFLKGGLVCGNCIKNKDDLIISDDCIKILRLTENTSFEKINKINIDKKLFKEINIICRSFYQYCK